jgi:NAD(P)-dependent dehydrogenase (short-subunit alcohol dehydrogenase family)
MPSRAPTTVPTRVLVTGGASGLGAALCDAFAARGDRVVVADLPGAPASTYERLDLDVRDEEQWQHARAWVDEHLGGLDVLVNNAGVAGGGRLEVCTLEEWRAITEVNLFGAVLGTRTFTPLFKQQRSGLVVNVASLAGLVHPAGMASYNATKAAVVALSETTGHELAQFGVRCAVVCPSYFRTGLVDRLDVTDDTLTQVMRRLVEQAPLGPHDIAAAVLEGLDRGDEVILPDPASRAAYDLKLADRAAYDRTMRAQADRLHALGGSNAP